MASLRSTSTGRPKKATGWSEDILKWFGASQDTTNSDLGKWFKSQYSGNASDYINSLDDASLGALLDQYYYENHGFLGNKSYRLDYNTAVKELEDMVNSVGGMPTPTAPDYQSLYNQAQQTIDAENAELLSLLDSNKARQTQNFQDELEDLNSSYNNYARQILSNDYMKNAQMLDSVSSALSKSKQNALEAGASAGARLAGNINTILAMQNKQTQQSLETSNQLAQQMLNQRQAAAGLRGNYNDMLASDTASRIGIKQGSAAQKNNYANQQFQTQQNIYDKEMQQYEEGMANHQSNPFYGSYQAYNQNKRYKNNQGY